MNAPTRPSLGYSPAQKRRFVLGKVPEQTLYSAISRKIAKNGRAARFKKAGREKFALRGEG